MSSVLHYGVDSVVEIESTGDLVADCRTPRGEPLADIAAAVSSALSEPLDFPPLRRSVVPGDRVAVALGAGVPHAAALASSLVANLLEAGIAPGGIGLFILAPIRQSPMVFSRAACPLTFNRLFKSLRMTRIIAMC